ncbi:MAG TPA: MotA/TolQ/ExbB proton channel family protein [Burkholderiales bacterium]|nr:MotA/TolQ/ExbB proton channel family protein [Burkholderiales bacterium]
MLAPAKSGEEATTLEAASSSPETRPPRYYHVLQFVLINVVSAALCAAAWLEGWLEGAFTGYSLWLCLVIIAVFLYGLGYCGLCLWCVVREHDDVQAGAAQPQSRSARYRAQARGAGAESRATAAQLLRMQLAQAPATVRHIAGILVLLGLVGTVIGFIVALSGVDPQKVPAVDNVAPMVARLINGMSIALYTTLIGSVLHLWLMLTQRILAGGALALYQVTVEQGERDARA